MSAELGEVHLAYVMALKDFPPPYPFEQVTGYPDVLIPIHRLKKQIQRSLLLAGCDPVV